ncbi:hypothetical protein CIW48_29935 [Methylobacterium sp. P1-11]|uniref:SPW repeat protein n=1 Tax=Methylobacterium sp. P1-11 TaxID=2024616 RepID=UPI0011EC03D8|nr:SPW repeat protein [Methylobacterium sp. P1-11]KAA0113162.1 hypothetical protein CIW48_29935 [Methylobacterium sp. P1-11]
MTRMNAAPSPSPTWRTDEILLGILQHTAGIALILTAWMLAVTDQARAAGSAVLPGLLIVMLYGANQIRFQAVLERVILLVGLWTLVAPWALRFAANDGATWAHVALGSVAVATALSLVRMARRP